MKNVLIALSCEGKRLPIVCLLLACCQLALAQATATLKFGNSYVNVTKKAVGGTVEPGDILEIRTTLYIRSNYNGGTGRVYFIRYVDDLPSKTDTISNDSLRLITNEGLTFRNYTLAPDLDAGTFRKVPPPGEYQVKINMGGYPTAANPTAPLDNSSNDATGASELRGNTNRPRFSSGTLVTTSFKVRVTGNVGDTITLGAGKILFKKTNSILAADTVCNAVPYKIVISANSTICGDAVGANFASEFGGTFGTGSTLNRATPPSFPIPGYSYVPNVSLANAVGDGFYAIVNNTSPKSATNINSRRTPNCNLPAGPIPSTDSCNNRMFNGFWFIGGDHSGTNTAAGNLPPASGTNSGYMLMVNADLATSEAYRQTITGLCPNTYYEFSAWVKNICPTCGIDSLATSTYRPGVLPNLTFVIDDIDYYSSGSLDTVGWQKKGFLFKTGPSQTGITISIRNNAPGGGGNDWVIDDINLATCTPQLSLTPNGNSNVCFGNQVDMTCVVRSYFNNYVYYEWEQSTNGGTTWTSTGVTGTGTPVLVSGAYQYTATYPSFLADSSTHNKMYRIKVASTATNLASSSCSFAASNTLLVLVNNCSELLKTSILSIDGKLVNNQGVLRWTTSNEEPGTIFEMERSDDNIRFTTLARINGKAPAGFGSEYSFTDPAAVGTGAYYRIRVVEGSNHKYSRIIYLNSRLEFSIRSMGNPFYDQIKLEIIVPESGSLEFSLIDTYGKVIRRMQHAAETGWNAITFSSLGGIPAGTYTLRVQLGERILHKRVVKL